SKDSHAVTIVLGAPYLGTPVINLNSTTLTESGGVLTSLSHVANSHPRDAELAIQAAQDKIRAAAAGDSSLTAAAEASTRTFLGKLLGPLGYSHVTVIFG